ncbi:Glucans biosynthesis protein G [Labeo rohita]|uniref:Glucans biosynthesis protein G n=1 Tax=Labeo rohita TaxID=84645 RepID=A0ABQ8L6V6_LABRO|nr:Glucans biosynthesis protein G [Labeo rohita]
MGVQRGGFRGSPGGAGDCGVLPAKHRHLSGSSHDSRPGPVKSFRERITRLLDKLRLPYMPRPSSGYPSVPPTTPVCSSPRTAPYRTPEAPQQPGLRPDRPNGQSSYGKTVTAWSVLGKLWFSTVAPFMYQGSGTCGIFSRGHAAGPDACGIAVAVTSYRVPRWAWHQAHIVCYHTLCCKPSALGDTLVLRASLPLGQVSRRTVSQQLLPSQAGVPCATGMQPRGSVGPSAAWAFNCLDLLTMLWALKGFRSLLGKRVLVGADNTATVAYTDHQDEPAQTQASVCHSLSGRQVSGGSALRRSGCFWSRFGQAQVDLLPHQNPLIASGGLVRHLSASTSRSVFSHHDLVEGRSVGHDLLRGVRKSGKPPSPLRQHLCLEFGPVNSHVALGTRPEYVPMVTTTPFRDQVVTLQAIPYQEDDPNLTLLCPVRVPRIYLERSQHFRRSGQLFFCYGAHQKGKAVSKQGSPTGLWIRSVRPTGQRLALPLGMRTQSTRGIAALAALANGASLTDIYRAAGWATPNTLANLRMEPVLARVLNASSWLSILVGCRACLRASPNGDYASKFQ